MESVGRNAQRTGCTRHGSGSTMRHQTLIDGDYVPGTYLGWLVHNTFDTVQYFQRRST